MKTVEELNLEHRKIEALERIANELEKLNKSQEKQGLSLKQLKDSLKGIKHFV